MITWGINALNHDASISVFEGNELKFHKRASEFSGQRGDDQLNSDLIRSAINAGSGHGPCEVIWYERPILKKFRQFRAGQWNWAFDQNEMPRKYLSKFGLRYPKIIYGNHHRSHAAAGFFTSPFDNATVVVLDAIGEWESSTIWKGQGTSLEKVWSRSYPTSLGIFYSAFTDLLGFKPTAEEHLLQHLSSEGDSNRYYNEVKRYWRDDWTLRENLHKGVRDWPYSIDSWSSDKADIAAAVQRVFEEQALEVFSWADKLAPNENIVYMGGCAMNSLFNQRHLEHRYKGIWSLPIPGDASSSIGCVLDRKKIRINYQGDLAKHIKIKYNNSDGQK